jgi:hypothetical protein
MSNNLGQILDVLDQLPVLLLPRQTEDGESRNGLNSVASPEVTTATSLPFLCLFVGMYYYTIGTAQSFDYLVLPHNCVRIIT